MSRTKTTSTRPTTARTGPRTAAMSASEPETGAVTGPVPATAASSPGFADASPIDHPAQRAKPTKKAAVLELLQQPLGATLYDLVALTKWQPHTTRAAVTRLRKDGYPIDRVTGDAGGAPRYRIAEPADKPATERTHGSDAGDGPANSDASDGPANSGSGAPS